MDNIEFLETLIKGINPFTGETISKASLIRAEDIKGRFEDILYDFKKLNSFDLIYSLENIDLLSAIINGKNPATNSDLDDDDPLKVDYVVECLKELVDDYVLISNNNNKNVGNDLEDETKNQFFYGSEQPCKYSGNFITTKQIPIELSPSITIQPFCKSISNAIFNALSYNTIQDRILDFLLNEGKIEERFIAGRMRKYATTNGEKIGISNGTVTDFDGKETHRVFYSPTAQIYIIDRLSLIFTRNIKE